MEELVNFLIEIGKLKGIKRRGWVLRGVKNPESIADHIFRTAIMAWIFSEQKELDAERVLKIALVHDLCEVYAGDTTPYDSLLPKNKKELKKIMKTLPRFSAAKKMELADEKYRREWASLKKLTSKLPTKLKKEIIGLWLDYEEGLTKEGRLVRQVDRIEDLLQALEYWEKDKKFPIKGWWVWAKEFFDESLLLEFMKVLDEKFHSIKKTKNK